MMFQKTNKKRLKYENIELKLIEFIRFLGYAISKQYSAVNGGY
jgi:hypothetical protein